MATVNTYLNFDGNCEEAFNFYKSVFGGEFGYLGRFREMPPQEGMQPIPEDELDKIMHISLAISSETELLGSDTLPGFGPPLVKGNNFSISIKPGSVAEADRIFEKLSAGGKVIMPMDNMFWGAYFGMFTDKFGINWMVNQEV